MHEIRVLLDQTAPLERVGDWSSAISVCREIFERSIAGRDIEPAIEAILRTGVFYRQLGERSLAEEHLQLAAELATLHEDTERLGRAFNGLATVHHLHGDLLLAEKYYEKARSLATQGADHRLLGNIEQNLGTLAAVRGNSAVALQHYESARSSYHVTYNQRGISAVLNNEAMLHISIGNLAAAERCLDNALEVARSIADTVTEGIVHINRTDLFLAQGNLNSARSSCDDAYEIVSRLNEHANRCDVLRLYGIIYRESNKLYLAERHLREAVEIAVTRSYPLEEAQAQRELALVLQAQDRNREALESLNRSHELFTSLQAEQYRAEIARRVGQLHDDFLALVQSWGESIEEKDRYTRGHCQRVAEYACRMALRMGLPEADMPWFRMGAFLHDVGKTEIPRDILNKPGRLTEEERLIIEGHTVAGDELLAPIPFPWDIRPMVRSHHERWDGNGYPDRLAGEQIPLTARILRLADVFDALTTTRSYREPLTIDEAVNIMENDRGAFDPQLFEAFRKLVPDFALMVSDALESEGSPALQAVSPKLS